MNNKRRSLLEKYVSLTLLKGFEKGYSRFYCEKKLETEQRLQYIDLPSPSGHRRVSFSFSWAAQPGAWGPGGPASLGFVLIPAGLVSKLYRGSQRPLLSGGGFLYHILSLSHLFSNPLTSCLPELYKSSIAHSISLEWHVCSSSSGNNCHAVHRLLSSGVSVYECTVGF